MVNSRLPIVALLFAVCWVSLATDYALQIYDEGSLLLGARSVVHGGMPLRDFWTAYPPGMFWLVAAAFSLFGEQLLVMRVMHVATVLGICVASYCLVLAVSHSRQWALSGFMAVTLYAGAVRTNYGYPPVLCALLGLGGLLVLVGGGSGRQASRALVAGLAAGACAVLRYDCAIYVVAASTAAMLAMSDVPESRSQRAARLARHLVLYSAGLLVPVIASYGVVVADVGAARAYSLLVDFPLRVYPSVRWLPFSWPFMPLLNAPRSAWTAANVLFEGARVPTYLALLTAPTTLVAALVLVATRSSKRREGALLLGLSVLAVGSINQFRVRPSEQQGWPLAVTGLIATVAMLSVVWNASSRSLKSAAIAGAVALSVVLVPPMLYRQAGLIQRRYVAPTVAVDSPWAAGIRIPVGEASYNELLGLLHERRLAGEPYLYSGVMDHDQLVFNDVLIYFLSGLDSPTFYPELVPGVTDTVSVQAEIVQGLESHAVQTALLYYWRSTEPNESSIDKRVDLVDTYLRERFDEVARLPPYVVLTRK